MYVVDPPSQPAEAGFTLLDSLVALTILSLAMVMVIRAYGTSARSSARAADAAEAAVLLQELHAAAELSGSEQPRIEIVPLTDRLVEIVATVETDSGQRFSSRTVHWRWEVYPEPGG